MKKPIKISLTTLAMIGATPSVSEAATVYQQAVLARNPILYWTFDETGDTDPAESLVNPNADNTLFPAGNASRITSTITSGGVSLGRAASFDGTLGSMFMAPDLFGDPTPGFNNDSPGADFIATQVWAVEFWFRAGASNQYFSETNDGTSGSNNPALIYNYGGVGTVELFSNVGRAGGSTATVGDWHHVVAAFYGNSNGFSDNLREIYINGVLTQSTTDTFSSGHGLRSIAIGNSLAGADPMNGAIDEYAIYELGNLPDLEARRAHVAAIAAHHALVPEPSTGLLTALAGFVLLLRRRC